VITVLRSGATYLTIFVMTITFGLFAWVGSKMPVRWYAADRIAYLWSWTILKVAGVKLDITGHENIDPSRAQVVIVNHLSNFDPLINWVSLWPLHYRFLAKKEVYKIPFFASIIRSMKMVKVDRQAGREGFEEINRQVRDVFDLGYSLIVYAEGTRSRTGEIAKFKKGAFFIARDLRVPVLPVSLHGSWETWQPGDWRIHGGTVGVMIHPLVEWEGTLEQMRVRVQETIMADFEAQS
jgi:1-acyl-sn-glycerol-3-phosphate acyltransferase